ncbi:MAG TPA: ABC transporter substrate-binding protein [Anaerolineae bacterium]|nr:ABC transporter substrate-binding protein [Anaerolineae bacterium]
MKRVMMWLILSVIVLASCTPAAAPTGKSLTKIRLPMGYIANVQYAPFYIAVDKGYFADEGLEIEFDYRYETDGMKLVGAGALPFAVVSGEQVPLARAQGLPVVYVLQWWQRFSVAVASLADKNIKTPADLVGKSVGLPGFFGASYIGWRGLLEKAGLKESDVKAQDIGFTQVAALQQGKVDAAVVYINNEPIQLRAAGLDVNVIPVSDYISLVANGIITNEKTIKENPELVRGFLRALLRGLKDAIADPELAFNTSKKFVEGLGTDPQKDEIQRKVLDETIKLWQAPALGRSDPEVWDQTQQVLIDMGLLKDKIPDEQLFANQFVDEVK